MKRIDGTSARQLDLLEEDLLEQDLPKVEPSPRPQVPGPRPLRLLQRDVFTELARRRRRAQIRARHLIAE